MPPAALDRISIAAIGGGVFLTPPTYFIEPERIAAYQSLIVEAFAPAAA